MGYGKAEVTGKKGDGGIDGILSHDILGFDQIYIQAKRWNSNVGFSEVRDFIGAMDTKGVEKGIFVTTSDFTKDAYKAMEISKSDKKIILRNGDQLAKYMIKYNLGVTIDKDKIYEIKSIDTDYFEENEL